MQRCTAMHTGSTSAERNGKTPNVNMARDVLQLFIAGTDAEAEVLRRVGSLVLDAHGNGIKCREFDVCPRRCLCWRYCGSAQLPIDGCCQARVPKLLREITSPGCVRQGLGWAFDVCPAHTQMKDEIEARTKYVRIAHRVTLPRLPVDVEGSCSQGCSHW